MNLLASDLRGEVVLLIAEDWSFRVICPKVTPEDRLKLVKVLFDAAQATAAQFGVKVEMKT